MKKSISVQMTPALISDEQAGDEDSVKGIEDHLIHSSRNGFGLGDNFWNKVLWQFVALVENHSELPPSTWSLGAPMTRPCSRSARACVANELPSHAYVGRASDKLQAVNLRGWGLGAVGTNERKISHG